MVKCPVCEGKGGLGAFGACDPGSVHFKTLCQCCNGARMIAASMQKCPTCNGQGGKGTFGPCDACGPKYHWYDLAVLLRHCCMGMA